MAPCSKAVLIEIKQLPQLWWDNGHLSPALNDLMKTRARPLLFASAKLCSTCGILQASQGEDSAASSLEQLLALVWQPRGEEWWYIAVGTRLTCMATDLWPTLA